MDVGRQGRDGRPELAFRGEVADDRVATRPAAAVPRTQGMRFHLLQREQWLPRPQHEVFAFFADARNLEAITPPWLGFRVVTPEPIEMREGAVIDYRLRLRGVPVAWHTRIDAWEPPHRFVDRQVRGPYRHWHHTHAFSADAYGTSMRDTVRYALPLGPLGALAHAAFVRRDLERIFDFRHAEVARRLGPARPPPGRGPKKGHER